VDYQGDIIRPPGQRQATLFLADGDALALPPAPEARRAL